MLDSIVPRFFLYGEPARAADGHFLHLEDLDDRSRPAAWRIRPHAHADLHQLFLISSGRGTISADGEAALFAAPCALIIPAGAVHGFVYETESTGRVLTVSDALLRSLTRQEPAFSTLTVAVQRLPLSDCASLDSAMNDLRTALCETALGQRTVVAARLSLILVDVVRLLRTQRAHERAALGAHARIVAGFRAAIEDSFRDAVPLKDYCDRLGTTPGRLRAACRVVAGATPNRLIAERIILEAKRTLTYSDLSVSDVAYGLGFHDPAYFSRFFTRIAGCPPSIFRRQG